MTKHAVPARWPGPSDHCVDLPVSLSWALGLIAALCLLVYSRALALPLISDDYIQIDLARHLGPVSGWPELVQDPLYRCRATSLILTHWTERLFGFQPLAFNASSLLLHIVNSWLVFALGFWSVVGWRISTLAACLFAVRQHHHEAIIWYAALPELLVFLFTMLCLHLWLGAVCSVTLNKIHYALAFVCFLLALASKESAVAIVPLMGLLAILGCKHRWVHQLRWLTPFAVIAVVYFAAIYQSRHAHLHFNDAGTFRLGVHFLPVIFHSIIHLVWVWGLLSVIAVVFWFRWLPAPWHRCLALAAVWIPVSLLPYSFLTYMPRVPSRHTYLAGVGVALVIAIGLLALAARLSRPRWAVWAVLTVITIHQCVYVWFWKDQQFADRAAPTERLIQTVQAGETSVGVRCFPYDRSVAELAVRMRFGESMNVVFLAADAPEKAFPVLNLCAAAH